MTVPKKIFYFKDYTEIRYKEHPQNKVTFLLGRTKSKGSNNLTQIMVLRDQDGDIPTNSQKWTTLQCKLMVLRNENDDTDVVMIEFVKMIHKGITYIIGADKYQNQLWTDDDEANYIDETRRDDSDY